MSASSLLLLLLLTSSQSQSSQICFIGDNLYANLKPFSSSRDPRVLMGTYTQVTIQDTEESTLSVDFDSAIYKHKYYQEPKSNYIFKLHNIGWVLSDNASPNTADINDIKLTCFEDDITDCLEYRWFWGYDSNQYPILPVGISAGACNTDMCLKNFEMTIRNKDSPSSNTFVLNGHLLPISQDDECTIDDTACDSNRTYWTNEDDVGYRWYYRVTKNANWVYGKYGSDRIACAPGYVETPLFCTTFVYASTNYTNYTFKPGLCDPTPSPTASPSLSPSAEPSTFPTVSPTDIPSCTKNYIFDAVMHNTTVSMQCPFGWSGSNIIRHCDMDGLWHTIADDCHLTSFTDDFTYFRDELWMDNTQQSYTAFTFPFRMDFTGFVDILSGCGGYNIALIDNSTSINARWDCDNTTLSIQNTSLTKQETIASNASNPYYINGYLLYRSDYNGDIVVSLQHNDNELLSITQDEWLSAPQQLSIDNDDTFTWTKVALTTFIDWFNPPHVISDIWTVTNDYVSGQYTSNSYLNIDPDTNRSYIELFNGGSISSNTEFEFISPFSMSMIFNRMSIMNNSIDNDITIQIDTSTSKRILFTPYDDHTYPSIRIIFRITYDTLYITLDDTEYSTMYTDCNDTDELYAQMIITEHNVSISVYAPDMIECGILSPSNSAYLQSSSLNWNSLRIAPTTDTDTVSISYFAAISDIEQDIITIAPSKAPTTLPTRDPDSYSCIDASNSTITYFEDDEFTKPCDYGYSGSFNTYRCLNDGTFELYSGCDRLSFGDEFVRFNDDIWSVMEPDYVIGRVALDPNINAIQLYPNNPALVSIIRSANPVVYPLKIRSTIIKRGDECNNWFIAVGTSYASRTSGSILLQYDCTLNEARLYNSSYKRYDKDCWTLNNHTNDSLDVTITIVNTKVTAYFDTITCANLMVYATDLTSDIEPYIWFGTYTNDDRDDIVGRFANMLYTQFYTEFDGMMLRNWKKIPSIDYDTYETIMFTGDSIIADDIYEFQVPFMVQLGIKRPWDKEITVTGMFEDEIEIQSGRYAHFIVFGDTEYVNEAREGVVQVVYDGTPRQRMVYTSNGVYVDSKHCAWGIYGKVFDITIQIDANILSVSDTLCSNTLYAKHDLDGETQSLMAIGMITLSDYGKDDFIAFDYIEVYQEPMVDADALLNEDDIKVSDMRQISDIYNTDNSFWEQSLYGFAMLYWVIAAGVLFILFIFFCCLVLWCLSCWPFHKQQQQHQKMDEELSPGSVGETPDVVVGGNTPVPHHERFETGFQYKDEEAEQINKIGRQNPRIVRSDDDEDGIDDVRNGPGDNVGMRNIGVVGYNNVVIPSVVPNRAIPHAGYVPNVDNVGYVPNMAYVDNVGHVGNVGHVSHVGNAGHVAHVSAVGNVGHAGNVGPVAAVVNVGNAGNIGNVNNIILGNHEIVNGNLMIKNTLREAESGGHSTSARRDNDDDDDIDLDGLVTTVAGAGGENKLQQENIKMQQELFWQRQFIEMIMSDPEQQATLNMLEPPQRKLYIEQEMKAYLDKMNKDENRIFDKTHEDSMPNPGESGFFVQQPGLDVFDIIKNVGNDDDPNASVPGQQGLVQKHPHVMHNPPHIMHNIAAGSSERIMNQLGMNNQHMASSSHFSSNPSSPEQINAAAPEQQRKYMKHGMNNNSVHIQMQQQHPMNVKKKHPVHHSLDGINMYRHAQRPQSDSRNVNLNMNVKKQHPMHSSMGNVGNVANQYSMNNNMQQQQQQQQQPRPNVDVMKSPAMIRLANADQQHPNPPPAMMAPHIIDPNDEASFLFAPNSMISAPSLVDDNIAGGVLGSGAPPNPFQLFHYQLPAQPQLADGIELESVKRENPKQSKNNKYID